MATKPATTFTHATDANFTGGPAIGNPTKIIPPTPAQGLVPGTGGASEFVNWLFNVIGQWLGWLNSGSSAAGEDAHIVETDSTGQTNVAGVVAGGTAAAYRPIVATENSGAAGATIDATNNSNGFAVLGTVNGSGAAIRGVSTGAGPALEAVGNLNVTGNSTLGNAGSDTLTISATLAAKFPIGAQEIEGIAGSVVDVESVESEYMKLQPVSPTVPTPGCVQWDGRTLNVGDNSLATARRVAVPLDSWVAGDISTASSITDTGAEVAMVMVNGEIVVVELHSEMTNTNTGTTINMRIEVNGGTIGGTAVRYVDSAGIYQSCYRTYQYTAPADGLYTFKARYGASAGTTTARNILLTARRAN